MHPTADTLAVELLHLAGRRVIGGVRLLRSFKSMPETCRCQRRAALSQSAACFPSGVALRMIFDGAWREVRRFEYRGSRQVLTVSIVHPNKPMHPTADTRDVILSNGLGRRVIGGVRRD
jgi:hypothetical protein